MLDAVAGWIAAQLSAEHVRSAELRFAGVVPGIARHIENSPPVEEVTAAQLAKFRARLRRDLLSAVRRAASRRSALVLQLGRESAPVVRAVKAAHLTRYYLPEELEVLLVGGRATGRAVSVLSGPSETVWEPPGAAMSRP
jgi:hypothetical protein